MGIKINISVFKNNKLLKKDKVFQFFTPEQLDSNNINMEIIYNKCKDKNNEEPFNIGENLQSYTNFELKEKYQIDISSQDEEDMTKKIMMKVKMMKIMMKKKIM